MPVSCSADTNQGETHHAEKQSRPLGNSERIRLKFGSYGIEVLENSPGLRVSSLYSTHDGKKINRTFAVTAYPEVIEAAFEKEHEAIINGKSIGIVFEENGWLIDKRHLYFGEIEAPGKHFNGRSQAVKAGMIRAAIHVYALVVRKNGAEFQYAFIAEVHHPEFLQLQDLAAIYGVEFETHLEKKEGIGSFLEVIESRILAL
jgi:hypothetical protein